MPDCQCLGVKAALTAALRGRPQPECPDHPRADDGEHQAEPIPLNRNSDLKAAILSDLKEPTQ